MHYPILKLKKNEDRRLRAGHLWIFSNEIDTHATPLNLFTAGDLVTVLDARNQPLGVAYVNPHTLLSARLLSRDDNARIDETWLIERVQQARQWRDDYFQEPYYRLVYGESDGLPGLIIDRFDDTLVLQLNTAGMEALKQPLLNALQTLFEPKRLILRNDGRSRQLEQLSTENQLLQGDAEEPLVIVENGARFHAPVLSGQKTGWFYDHRDNRARLQNLVSGKRVLDVFSYLGGWSIQAACFGASEVHCVDSSKEALSGLQQNAELNQVESRIKTHCGDAFTLLAELKSAKEKFDVVVLDPPALIPRKKDIAQGKNAYQRLNQLALQLLNENGILVSASCSSHLHRAELIETIQKATEKVGTEIQIFSQGGQGADHPIHPAIPETEYLKTIFARKVTLV